MDWLFSVINWLTGLGATVMMPLTIFVIALVLGAKAGKAFRASLTIAAAFVGLT